MRLFVVATAVALLAASVRAEPAHVTVVTKDARHSGTLSAAGVEVKTAAKAVGVSWTDVWAVQFGDGTTTGDVIRTREQPRKDGRSEIGRAHEHDPERGGGQRG